ncbi:hypothetical protein HN873_039601 [Arachis hypogaea]
MRNIVLKLAELMIQTSGGNVNNEHLQKCIGSAIIVMGVERFLEIVPITLDERSFAYSNIWLVPILKRYVTGSSLAYYMEHIVPLAKSFKKASRKVKKTRISEDLLTRAHELWGLLPSFCRHANDTHQNFASLSDVLVSFLKKQPSMHENVFMALQVLVNENKAVLIPKKSESNCHAVCDSELEFGVQPAYSKKAATRNIKSLASCSRQLLSILSDLFIASQPEMRFSLKGAIGCLASITDSSVIKEMFLSFLDKFKFTDCEGNIEMLTSDSGVLDSKLGKMENYSKRIDMVNQVRQPPMVQKICVRIHLLKGQIQGSPKVQIPKVLLWLNIKRERGIRNLSRTYQVKMNPMSLLLPATMA